MNYCFHLCDKNQQSQEKLYYFRCDIYGLDNQETDHKSL